MKCPKCHTDNPDTQRFCGECGTQLSQFDSSRPRRPRPGVRVVGTSL